MDNASVTDVVKQATVVCPFCETLNRVDLARLADRPKCGSCGRPILLDRPLAVSDATLDAVLAGTQVPVIVDCYADWCGPCKVMAPVLDDLARDRQGTVAVAELDPDRHPKADPRMRRRAIPTFPGFRPRAAASVEPPPGYPRRPNRYPPPTPPFWTHTQMPLCVRPV